MRDGHYALGLFGSRDWGSVPLIRGLGGILVEPIGFIMMNIKGKAHSLLKEYHDIFSLEKRDMGHTNATEHKIVI